jgi:hypothetical protein
VAASGSRLEGTTKADAMLLAEDTGVAVTFEAKVLSDVSTNVTFNVARNQLRADRRRHAGREPEATSPVEPPNAGVDLPGAVDTRGHPGWTRRGCDQQEQALRLAHAYKNPTVHCSASTCPTAMATN